MSTNKNGKFTAFMSGKGFYVALALCLVGAGTAAWVVVDRTLGSITDNGVVSSEQSVQSTESSWGFPADTEETGRKASKVEISSSSSEPSSSQSTASSSSVASSVASAPSEQQTLLPEPQTSVFVLPIKSAEVFNEYSGKELVKNTTLNKWCTHDGIDLKAALGTEVMASADGVVGKIYQSGVWGKTVEVAHENGFITVYYGLADDVSVKEGDAVSAEQVIAKVGDTNLAESGMESHLHFAVKQNDAFVNPLEAMGKL